MPAERAARGGRWDTLRLAATGWPGAVCLLAASALLGFTSAAGKSATFDEVPHLTAGYAYWAFDDYRLHPENGNLPQRWAALPAFLGGSRFPAREPPDWPGSAVYRLGYRFLYETGNDPASMLRRGRAMVLLLALALGVTVYSWSRELFGAAGAFVSLTLCCFCPHLLAHGSLITSDVAAALFFLLASGAAWRLLHGISPGRLAASALAVSGLLLSKMSGVLIVPMVAVPVLFRLFEDRGLAVTLGGWTRTFRTRSAQLAVLAAAAAVHAVVAWAAIWTLHGFHYTAFRAAVTPTDRFEAGVPNLLGTASLLGRTVQFAEEHHLLPEAYLYGFSFAVDQSQRRPAFLAGERRDRGWIGFFPYAFAVKTSESLFLVLALALWAALKGGERIRGEGPGPPLAARLRAGLHRTAPLWSLLVVYWLFAVRAALNIGHRHLLPTYPALFILAGAAGGWFGARARGVRVVLGLSLSLVAATAIAAWPDYLAYFNRLSGGPARGYRHLVDSSLDWGQDLPGLRAWLDRHAREAEPVYLSYFGSASPDHHGIPGRRLPGFFDFWRRPVLFPLSGGIYCISASMLQLYGAPELEPWGPAQESRYQDLRARFEPLLRAEAEVPYADAAAEQFDRYRLGRLLAALRGREPDDHVGHSILIFRLTDADVRNALAGPPPHEGP
jgi:hypothetical protein